MTLTVDNPILNSPYREPERYWLYDAAGMPRVENGRRPVGCYFRARAGHASRGTAPRRLGPCRPHPT